MEVISPHDNAPNEEEDEEPLLHDIDKDVGVGEEVEARNDIKTLKIFMEKEIEGMMDKLERNPIHRKPIAKLINPITSNKQV